MMLGVLALINVCFSYDKASRAPCLSYGYEFIFIICHLLFIFIYLYYVTLTLHER